MPGIGGGGGGGGGGMIDVSLEESRLVDVRPSYYRRIKATEECNREGGLWEAGDVQSPGS
jgi:hypothetical protein